VPAVVIDDYKGAFLATEHLIKNGYTRIAHVSGPQHINGFRDRLNGYADALKKHQLKVDKKLIYPEIYQLNREGKQWIIFLN
jgi:LacI family transcriptional regulator